MRKYGNKMIANPGNYITDSNGKRGIYLIYDSDVDYSEHELSTFIEKRPYNSVSIGGIFNLSITNHIKKTLINHIWSNDDQIAIILNKDNSPEDLSMFNFMQEWRNWFGKLNKEIQNLDY